MIGGETARDATANAHQHSFSSIQRLCCSSADKRGAVVGVLAFVIYGVVLLAAAFDHREWSRRHVVLDALLLAPLGFLALAYLTDLALVVCLVLAIAVGLAFTCIVARRSATI